MNKVIKFLLLKVMLLTSIFSFADPIEDKYFKVTDEQYKMYLALINNPNLYENYPRELMLYEDCNLKNGCRMKNSELDMHNVKSFNNFKATIIKISNGVRYANKADQNAQKIKRLRNSNDTPILYGNMGAISAAGASRMSNSKSDVKTRNSALVGTVVGLTVGTIVGSVKNEKMESGILTVPTKKIFILLDDGRKAKFDRDYYSSSINDLEVGVNLEFIKDQKTNLWQYKLIK